ncbi:hypothetical protein ACMD2_24586 [Ananas comosus]|uniref:Uncharacterized protein n=1 Tax=Ananas comosus TaxID=4615 RepID=A0A199W6T6_ANACO|nr:hypothetical protein ACMD2_24586 [Ananas comosus]
MTVIGVAMGNIKRPALLLLLPLLLLILVSIPHEVQSTGTKDSVGKLMGAIRRSSGTGSGGHGGGSSGSGTSGNGATASGGHGSGESSGAVPVAGGGAVVPRNAGAAVHHRRHNAAGRSRSFNFFLAVTVNTILLAAAVLAY